ncbi:hypothetical protein [Leptothoe sp. PORK10 BA2]|uniref:hypothetical protein n=1 Tax=Leptothoe sp. PORK10 BA2 TaxID=3110254 RepID=UPI002B1F708B|nr:hypothetical protein [Leptothoe sp. PORK10 BA2]MEA5464059.1 hypothetical protein [Leptothoe sp. PORK10 BA2]
MGYQRWLMIGGLSVAVAVGVYAKASSTAQTTWQLAGQIAPPELLKQIGEEHLSSPEPVNLSQMRAWKIHQPRQSAPLYLIDTRVTDSEQQPLCGKAGCAFLGYIPGQQGYQTVFNTYLDPHLPPNTDLLSVTDELQSGLPTLTLHQLDGQQLQRFTVAFDGTYYAVVTVDNLSPTHE